MLEPQVCEEHINKKLRIVNENNEINYSIDEKNLI